MKYKLMVSRDCGINYNMEHESDSVEVLKAVAEPLSMWRWYIEDENSKPYPTLCPVHASIFYALEQLKRRKIGRGE